MPAVTDSRLGPYTIISLIGSGAMGEVYRARDTRLNRDVALKVVSADPESMRRFESEARAIASLNHPNILTVHDAGVEDGKAFLVTELIQGDTLRKVLSTRGALPMARVLEYGVQIAEGLAAAHDEGIVHRDLKPENIMLGRDGRVKILDFGIAKAIDIPFSDSNATAPGVLIGTSAYMSPEQARGARVTYFADQFALGLVLFEMATGEPAFKRDTPLATLSAILADNPPELTVGSMRFRWLVTRLLHKDPDHRYVSMHDVVRELNKIREDVTDVPTAAAEAPVDEPPRRRFRFRLWPWLLLLGAVVAGAVLWYYQPFPSTRHYTFTPYATHEGLEVTPAWSPDGRTLVWAAERDGVLQLVAGGRNSWQPTQITHGTSDALFPFWSPDGARVYYMSGGALWVVGATGGEATRLLGDVVQADIAPDGRTFALLRPEAAGFRVNIGPLDRLTPVGTVVQPWSYLRFAPDGKRLGAWVSLEDGRSEFRVISNGQVTEKLSDLSSSPLAREFSWLDDRRVVFSDRTALSTGSHLWVANLRTGRVDAMTSGTGSEFSPSASRDRRSVAFAAATFDYDIVELGFDGRMHGLKSGPRFEVSPSTRADAMAWITDRTGQPELWFRDRPIVTSASFGDNDTTFLFDAELSPDGRRVAFRRSGAKDESIWVATAEGGSPVRLTREPGDAFQRGPTWSPDGNHIAYYSVREGRYVVVRSRVGTSETPVVIARDAGTYPRWSPKGDLIAALGPQEGVTIVALDGSARRTAGSGQWLLQGWSQDGSALYGVRRTSDRRLEIVQVRIADARESVVADLGRYPAAFTYGVALGSMPLRGFSLTETGIVTSMLKAESDIWLLHR
jgi:Tol biopolymer transport system component/predicted Ser/Thr protein kinase